MIKGIQDWFRWSWGEWDRFWFTPVNPSLLGIIRLLAGGMIFYTHLVWTLGLEDFFGPEGWQRPELMKLVQDRMISPSFWWYVPEAWLFPIHYLCLGILAAFMLGLATRVTSILAFLITVSYAYRAQCANFGLDQVNALLALYLAIGPSGSAWSIDSLLRRLFGLSRGTRSVTANISLRLIQIHLCIIYAFAGIAKLQGDAWWNGYAIWMAAANEEYQSGSLLWLAAYPHLYSLLSHITIAWELSFWTLVWHPRLRLIVLLIGVAVHLGIGAFLGMWTFGLAMIIAYLGFVPPQWFDRQQVLQPTQQSEESQVSNDWQARLNDYIETHSSAAGASQVPSQPGSSNWRTPAAPIKSRTSSTPAIVPSHHSRAVTQASGTAKSQESEEALEVPTFPERNPAEEEENVPVKVLVVEPRVERQFLLQESFLQAGHSCQAVGNLVQAAGVLATRECRMLFLNAVSMSRKEWEEFLQIMGDHPGPGLSLIIVLQGAQWNWRDDLPESNQIRYIRYPYVISEVLHAAGSLS